MHELGLHGEPNRPIIRISVFQDQAPTISRYLESDFQTASRCHVQVEPVLQTISLINHRYNLSAFAVKYDDTVSINHLNEQCLPPHNQKPYLEYGVEGLAQDE